jgi:hypothetical protein
LNFLIDRPLGEAHLQKPTQLRMRKHVDIARD